MYKRNGWSSRDALNFKLSKIRQQDESEDIFIVTWQQDFYVRDCTELSPMNEIAWQEEPRSANARVRMKTKYDAAPGLANNSDSLV